MTEEGVTALLERKMDVGTDRSVLEIISAPKRLDFRWLENSEKQEVKRTFERLYLAEKLSTREIADELGRSQNFVWRMCKKVGISLRTPEEGGRLYAPKRTPNIRRPFDGTKLDRAYLQGFARGDLDFRRVSTLAIQVSTTTTHPDFVSLFTMLFRRYGPLYVYPCRDEVRGYRWKVAARVDNSLDFLVGEKMRPCPTFKSKGEFWSWLAGIIDSDGSVGVIHSGS